MTRMLNARLAGSALLVYIAAGIASMVVFGKASSGDTIARRLAAIAQHQSTIGVVLLLAVVQCFCALVLGVTLWAITREEDPDLSMLGLVCRVAEGIIGATSIPEMQRLMWLASSGGTEMPNADAVNAFGTYMLKGD